MRIGIGYDIHRLVEERPLFLGGVEIPYVKGLLGYSDGDVLLHAISDAILGAMSKGDIGEHFPNTDPQYKGMASSQILDKVISMMRAAGLSVENIDATIIAEEPAIHPFRTNMIEKIAALSGVSKEQVNIKATTNEGVGSMGRGEAIAAYAVVLLKTK